LFLKKDAKTFGYGRDAFLLDLDGTIVDIAPTPDAVTVAPGLLYNLRALRDRCGGALGVITGRSLREVDALLGDAPFAVAAEHGTMLRHAPGEAPVMHALGDVPPAWLAQAQQIAAANPGVILERKRHGFVLHYRGAPSAGKMIEHALQALLDNAAGFTLLAAKMAWEIRPAGVDKGFAVHAIMARAPFAGRLPVFVGDDITDEDGIEAAVSLGGAGFRVDEIFGDPAGVRAWIADLARSPLAF
jgi:trehalose 6-phosphate phosphatase